MTNSQSAHRNKRFKQNANVAVGIEIPNVQAHLLFQDQFGNESSKLFTAMQRPPSMTHDETRSSYQSNPRKLGSSQGFQPGVWKQAKRVADQQANAVSGNRAISSNASHSKALSIETTQMQTDLMRQRIMQQDGQLQREIQRTKSAVKDKLDSLGQRIQSQRHGFVMSCQNGRISRNRQTPDGKSGLGQNERFSQTSYRSVRREIQHFEADRSRYQRQPICTFRKVTPREKERMAEQAQAGQKVKVVKFATNKQGSTNDYLDKLESQQAMKKQAFKDDILQRYMEKQIKPKRGKHQRSNDELEDLDLNGILQVARTQGDVEIKAHRQRQTNEKVGNILKDIKQDTTKFIKGCEERDFELEGSEASSFYDPMVEREVDIDNAIINRLQNKVNSKFDAEGQPTEQRFKRNDRLQKIDRLKMLADYVIKDDQASQNHEFLQQQKQLVKTTARQNSLFATMNTFVDSDKECDEKSGSDSDTQQPKVFRDDFLKRRENKLSKAIKKALIRSLLDGIKNQMEKSNDQSKLQTCFRILSTEMDPYNSIIQKQLTQKRGFVDRMSQVVNLLQFMEIGKFIGSEAIRDTFSSDPMMVYHHQLKMSKGHELALPLVNKVIQGKLILRDYTLDTGHCKALAQSIKQTQKPLLNAVYLENCGVTDEEIAQLLEGLQTVNGFSSLVYKQNVFNIHALNALKPCLIREQPHNLLELRIVNCRADKTVIWQLITFMLENDIRLRGLGLVQMSLKRQSLNLLAKFVATNIYLESLDISWNDVLPFQFVPLLHELSYHKNLRSLNLSWNYLLEKDDMNNEAVVIDQTLLDDHMEARLAAMKAGKATIAEDKSWQKDHQKLVLHCLSKMVRRNKNLQTLILSNCGLNELVLTGLVRSLRHSKGLICLHLDHNPGISDKVVDYYNRRLKCKQDKFQYNIEIPLFHLKSKDEEVKSKMNQVSLWQAQQTEEQTRVEEVCQYINNARLKNLVNKNDVRVQGEGRNLSLSRVLGHKELMPGAAQWHSWTQKERESCWACDNWNYVIVFWNKHIGKVNNRHSIQIDPETKKQVIQKIKLYSKEEGSDYKTEPDRPVLFSSATNWQPKPLMNIIDVLNNIDGIILPDYSEQIWLEAKGVFGFENLEDLEEDQKIEYDQFVSERRAELQKKWRIRRIKQGPEIIRNSRRYKQIQTINEHLLHGASYDDMWVIPLFMKAGRTDIIIRGPQDQTILDKIDVVGRKKVRKQPYQEEDDCEFFCYYERQMIQIREEIIPPYSKELKVSEKQFVFDRNLSVFRDWKEDDAKTITKCSVDDLKNWKLQNFVKDFKERERVTNVIIDHYPALKEIQTRLCCSYKPPDISLQNFCHFLRSASVLTPKLHQGIVAVHWNATNFEKVAMDQNDDKDLCRFEFMEIIVRIAHCKFVEFGKMSSLSEALAKLINEHLKPAAEMLIPWQGFRESELWCTEMHEMLMVNQIKLQKLYRKITELRDFRPRLNLVPARFHEASIDQIVTLLNRRIPDIFEKDILKAFFLCKMTTIEPLVDGNYSRTFLKWVEFLEFLPRLAYFKYQRTYMDQDWPLVRKIKPILDSVLDIIGEDRLDPPELVEVISESDDDY